MSKNILIIIVVLIVVIAFILIANMQINEKKITDKTEQMKAQTLLEQQNRKNLRTQFLMNLIHK